MNMQRIEWLTDSLRRYLDRRTMPQGLRDKPLAQQDEVKAMVKTLNKIAPVKGYQEWWDDFCERLAEHADTRAWPTQNEMAKAAKITKRPTIAGEPRAGWRQKPDGGWEIDALYSAAEKIRKGEAVSAGFLWGRMCVEMQDQEGITDAQLQPYRSALFFADKDMVDESGALDRENNRKILHEAAKQRIWEGHRGNRRVPDMKTQGFAQ